MAEPGTPEDLSSYLTVEGAPPPSEHHSFAAYMRLVEDMVKQRRKGTIEEIAMGARHEADEERESVEKLMESLLTAVYSLVGKSNMPRSYPWEDRVVHAIKALGAFEAKD